VPFRLPQRGTFSPLSKPGGTTSQVGNVFSLLGALADADNSNAQR
jgi:hypothetical protein